MAALCELDIAWRGLNYSGQMSLLIDYPDRLRVEVYSPFGDTVLYIERDDKHFLFIGGDEKVSDEEGFKERFGIDLKGLIDDILLIGVYQKGGAEQCVEKKDYRVIYRAHGDADKMCIEESKTGANRLCIKFVEVSFHRDATKAQDQPT